MPWRLISVIVVAAFAIVGGYACLRRRPDWLLLMIPLSIGLGGFNVYAGTIWFPIKVLTAWSLLYVVSDLSWLRAVRRSGLRDIWLFVLWIVVCLGLAYVISTPIMRSGSALLQSRDVRPFVQFYSYVSTLALIPLAILGLRRLKSIDKFYEAYSVAAAVVVVGALLQLALYATGHPFMPILRINGVSDLAAFGTGDGSVLRIYSFAGEPKQLGIFLMPLVGASFSRLWFDASRSRPWWAHPGVVAVEFVTLLLTFSSAVFIALALCAVPVVLLVARSPKRASRFALACSLIVVGALLAVPYLSRDRDIGLLDIAQQRTVDRLDRTGNQRPEVRSLEYMFLEHPVLTPTGVGLGMFNYHVPGLFGANGAVEPIDSGWVQLFMDIGLIGCFLLLSICMRVASRAVSRGRTMSRSNRLMTLTALGGMTASIMILTGTNAMVDVVLWLGVASYCVALETSRRMALAHNMRAKWQLSPYA